MSTAFFGLYGQMSTGYRLKIPKLTVKGASRHSVSSKIPLDSFIHMIYILHKTAVQLMVFVLPEKELVMSQNHSVIMDVEENIYAILDQVAETGIPVTVKRKGKPITISCAMTGSKLDRLEDHPDFFKGDPEDVVHMDWSGEWAPNI